MSVLLDVLDDIEVSMKTLEQLGVRGIFVSPFNGETMISFSCSTRASVHVIFGALLRAGGRTLSAPHVTGNATHRWMRAEMRIGGVQLLLYSPREEAPPVVIEVRT